MTDEASKIRTTCKCEKGNISCKSEEFIRKRSTVIGDPHFKTFDNVAFDFMGVGSYLLLETDNMEITSNFVQCKSKYCCLNFDLS